MTPTAKLRFVERQEVVPTFEIGTVTRTVRILQQWWEGYELPMRGPSSYLDSPKPTGEWRDIPIEREA